MFCIVSTKIKDFVELFFNNVYNYDMRKLKQLRLEKGVRQEDVAKAIGISFQVLSHYENGRNEPDYETLKKLAEYFNVTTDYLLGASIIPQAISTTAIRVPILGHIPAGTALEMIEDILDFEELNPRQFNPNKEWFGLRIKGDSMTPKYIEGDNIIIEKRADCESGNDCIIIVNGYDATLKRVFKNEVGITLQPLNSIYPAAHYSNKQIKELPVTILGVVKEIRRQA